MTKHSKPTKFRFSLGIVPAIMLLILLPLFQNCSSGSGGGGGGGGNGGGEGAADADTPTPVLVSDPASPWTYQTGIAGKWAKVMSLSVGSADNTYAAGSSNASFNAGSVIGTSNAFVTKVSTLGERLWIRHVQSSQTVEGRGAAAAPDGVYVTGSFIGKSSDLGNSVASVRKGFLVHYDSAGNLTEHMTVGLTDNLIVGLAAVATDSNGNVAIAGYAAGVASSLNGESNPAPNQNIAVLVTYTATGGLVERWTRLLGVTGENTIANAVKFDSAGNSIVCGHTTGSLAAPKQASVYDFFVAKYSPKGVLLWSTQMGAGIYNICESIAFDSSDNVYVTGETNGNLDGETKSGNYDLFITKYDANGIKQWTKLHGQAGGATTPHGIAITSGATPQLQVTGQACSNLGGQTLNGLCDAFLARFDMSGDHISTKLWGSPGAVTDAYALDINSLGQTMLGGYTSGHVGTPLIGLNDLILLKEP